MSYRAFLELCGYEKEEINQQGKRIEKAIEKLRLGPEDFRRAEQRINEYFDIDLISIRKTLGLWFKSLVDVVLTREEGKKLVYTMMPPLVLVQNAMTMASTEVYVTAPDILLNYTFGAIFGNQDPILEAAEADLLPLASCYCGGIKAELGAISLGLIPLPDLMVASGFVCDQTPKVDEIIHERYGIPVVYIDGTLDEEKGRWADGYERRLEYLVEEGKNALKQFELITGFTVTDDMLEKANVRAKDLRVRCKDIARLYFEADPTPTSFNNIALLFRAANWLVNPSTYGQAEEILDLCYEELRKRVENGKGVVPKGAPRVAMLKVCNDPVIVDRIEKLGLAVVADNTGIIAPKQENFSSRYNDFWHQGIELFLRMGVGCAARQVELFKDLGVDGLILNYPVGCRDQCVGPMKVQEIVRKEMGIPSLVIEFDHTESRVYTADVIGSRVEPFAEMLKEIKAAKSATT
ncbi:MAG TPA: 2-hydroxyacyl-CoA dehydratase family protein [Syntrophorhabdaceae bacterium]|nr:2-hydroxyacyl-CoA dehydratase family protein [Syntrophorhabdaceae bacterium]